MSVESKRLALGTIAVFLFVLLGLTLVPALHKKVDGQPSDYSLIVVDRSEHEWVVDYNLTRQDCESMAVSQASYCSRQPEGEIQ